jgi:hypothetical protein
VFPEWLRYDFSASRVSHHSSKSWIFVKIIRPLWALCRRSPHQHTDQPAQITMDGGSADKTNLGFSLFAGAASICTYGGILAAIQPMSRKRTLITDFEQLIQSAFFAAWRLDTKNAGPLHGDLLELIRKPNALAHIRLSLVPKLPSKPSTNLGVFQFLEKRSIDRKYNNPPQVETCER